MVLLAPGATWDPESGAYGGNLYAQPAWVGDVNAVRRGTVGRRLVNNALGRTLVRRLWR